MELLINVGHVESRFGPFADSARVGARYIGARFAPNIP
jgi:hypothetical protein